MVIATGFFDGVHIGHRAVISTLCRIARERGEQSMVVTFWPHPRTVLQQDAAELRLLTSLEEKKRMLYGLGVDRIEVIGFTHGFSRLTAEEFIRDYLIGKFGATTLVLGYDHRLGGGPPMSREELECLARRLGLETFRLAEEDFDGMAVSSTAIRKSLSAGDVERANTMLGYRYSLHGVVVSGNRIGRELGFPTANLSVEDSRKILPGNGVYAVWAVLSGKRYKGMLSIGNRPTLDDGNSQSIEVYLLDFSGDLYGKEIEVSFVSKIRDNRKFPSLLALKSQLEQDRQTVSECLI